MFFFFMWKMLKRNIKLCTFFSVFLDEWWGNYAADYVYALLPVWLLRKCDRAIWELKLWAGFFFKKKLISFFIFWDPKKVNLTWKRFNQSFGLVELILCFQCFLSFLSFSGLPSRGAWGFLSPYKSCNFEVRHNGM